MPHRPDLLIRQTQRHLARLEPEVARAVLRALEELRRILGDRALARIIEGAGADRAALEALTDEELDRALEPLRVQLQDTLQRATILSSRRIPGAQAAIVFNVLNPRVIDAINTLDTRVMQTLREQIRETFRDEVRAGLELGVGPRVTARKVRDTLGLAPNQAQAVRNFRRMLENGDREALTRALRDRRFDRTLQRALGRGGTGLGTDQIERMVGAYRRRMIAFNAETNARTATIDALKLGQRLSWKEAGDRGLMDPARLMKRWATVGDSRVRPTHVVMNGEIVAMDEPFSNGQTIPGEDEFNCRCLAVYFQQARSLASPAVARRRIRPRDQSPAQRVAARRRSR